jgi:hypothetical protein
LANEIGVATLARASLGEELWPPLLREREKHLKTHRASQQLLHVDRTTDGLVWTGLAGAVNEEHGEKYSAEFHATAEARIAEVER